MHNRYYRLNLSIPTVLWIPFVRWMRYRDEKDSNLFGARTTNE
ncbi:hypothetical protein RRSWK_00279 [Rhodopirellula sp. SWK7]|nr:hypothetical protein RRSWK_00279 [Rhodopirellula sp. SWK7]